MTSVVWTPSVLISLPCGLVTKSCPTVCDPMDPPGSSLHGILQARILEWVAMSFSRESPQPRDQTQVSHASGGLLHWRWILYQLSQQPESPFIFSYHCVRHNHFKIRVISQGRLSQTHVVLLIWQRENASSTISWKVLNDLTSLSLWLPLFYLHWRFQSSSNSLGTFLPPHPHIPYFIFLD